LIRYHVVKVSGHFDYARQMDAVLEVIGIRTRQHAELGAEDSLQQWSALQRCKPTESPDMSTATLADSAIGDEVEEGLEATEFIDISEDSVHS